MSLPQSGTSIQPLGDYTTMGQGNSGGNPTYRDASAGPQAKTPNADPHMMQKKRKKAELHDIFSKMLIEGKVFSPTEAGYVESPISKQCGTCEYFAKPNICLLPLDIPVDAAKGCCNFWEAKELNSETKQTNSMSEVKLERKYCRSCSKGTDEKSVTCADCGSMEFTTSPMSKFTYQG